MPLVSVEGLSKTFPHRRGGVVHAVRDVSFSIEAGETLALIGESGSGKSTIGRLVLGLIDAGAGNIEVAGRELGGMTANELRAARSEMQMVFQEPFESLNPTMRVGAIVREPLVIHESGLRSDEVRSRVDAALTDVGLGPEFRDRFPRSLSGGQQQRVGIARALVTRPKFLVLDEPTSSLDLSVQAQVLELLADLQSRYGLTYLYVTHDLGTVSYLADRVAVLYLGQIREVGSVDVVLNTPSDPYTRALMSASLSPDPSEPPAPFAAAPGEVSGIEDVVDGEGGCRFFSRCPDRIAACRSDEGTLEGHATALGEEHLVRCIRVGDLT